MSLILDALNRSRQDADQMPGLATQHYESIDPSEPPGWRKWLPWLALGAALAVIVWLVLERDGEPGVEISAPEQVMIPAPTESEPVPLEQDDIAKPAAPEEQPDLAAARQRSSGPGASSVAVAAAESPKPKTEVEPESTGQSQAAVTALYQQQGAPASAEPAIPQEPAPPPDVEPAVPETHVDEQPVDIQKMVSRARDEMENAELAEHPAPFIADLSQQTKDGIPTIFYRRHSYSGNSANSQVVLNGKELRVGGRPAAGVKVDEILPDSVVLSFQGTQFRLRALNSWVNL